ncbi:hypothetical protein [Rhodococcus opacus]|uniref:hypothetical protein n=1 Tax=Rhodococcus opacus TaxID=37919 RepID=UPI002949434C|nr:hypothetical protein [Rhodococcus opacus]MDV6247075.1 hypothetical protein [Rhodococcus opacus]
MNLRAGRSVALDFLDMERKFHQYLVDTHLRVRQISIGTEALCTNPKRQRRICDEHHALTDSDEARAHIAIQTHSTQNNTDSCALDDYAAGSSNTPEQSFYGAKSTT